MKQRLIILNKRLQYLNKKYDEVKDAGDSPHVENILERIKLIETKIREQEKK